MLAALAVAAISHGATLVKAQTKQEPDSWVKLCDSNTGKKICLTHYERRDRRSGKVVVSAALREINGQDEAHFIVLVPFGMSIPSGVHLRIDDKKLISLSYKRCGIDGCTAELPATKAFVEQLRKRRRIVVTTVGIIGETIKLSIPLHGFMKAHDGPPVASRTYRDLEIKKPPVPYDPVLPKHLPFRPKQRS